jgi:hypothetical protein
MASATDLNISAAGLQRNFGWDAEAEARRIAITCAARSDKEGEVLWLAIERLVAELQSRKRLTPESDF